MLLIDLFFALFASLAFGVLILRLFDRIRLELFYNIAILAFIAALAAYALLHNISASYDTFSFGPFSLYIILIVSASMALVDLIAYNRPEAFGDFAVLSAFSIIGMMVVAVSYSSLIGVFLGFELMTLPSAFAILLDRKGLEAAVKFFVVAALAIAIFSFGMAMFYGSIGGLSLVGLTESDVLLAAGALLIVAIGFEASAFPFNLWVPDVYEGSPSYVTAMLGGLNKKIGIVALIEVTVPMLAFGYVISGVIAVIAVLTMFYGNLAALWQEDMKRLFAYSSISQAGYMFIGISAASSYGVGATLFQIFTHMFVFIGIFAIIALMEGRGRKRINDFIGLASENRIVAAALVVFILALIGMPFTDGFVGKFLLFSAAIYSKLAWLAILGILNSVISVFYYSKVIINVYARKHMATPIRVSASLYAVIVVALALTVFFGIYPATLISIAQAAAAAIFH